MLPAQAVPALTLCLALLQAAALSAAPAVPAAPAIHAVHDSKAKPQVATPAPAGPCLAQIKAIRPGSIEPDPFLAAAACLRRADSARAAGASDGAFSSPASPASPESPESPVSPASPPGPDFQGSIPVDSTLKRLLPASESWYVTHLERLRARRDTPRLLDMAWLAALKNPPGRELWKELAEVHAMAGEPIVAALAYLRQAERDSSQWNYTQYQLENFLRSLSDVPIPALLDSVDARFHHASGVTAEILESLCLSNRHFPCAYRNTLAYLALKRPAPPVVLDRAGRYQTSGYPDYASGVLEKAGWRTFPKPWHGMARTLFLRVRFQMEDWPAIAQEMAIAPKGMGGGMQGNTLSEEEEYIAAAAALRLGRAPEALSRLERFATLGENQWAYRGQILKARALLSLGRLPEAAKVLDVLKRSPLRRDGTGPILFWQGWLALQQGREVAAESLLVLASAYTGNEESQRALEYRYWILLDSGAARVDFLRGLAESPLPAMDRIQTLDRVPGTSALWPYARIEIAQILAGLGRLDSARAVLDQASKQSQDRLVGLKAEAMAAYLQEKTPGGRSAALARYEDLLIKYQQGVVPEFSRGRIRALK